MKLSRQKEIIVEALRSMKWVCGSAWLGQIKDDRRRICDLESYMAEKGYKIIGEPCRGRACNRSKCPLYMRKAVKLQTPATLTFNEKENNERLREFDMAT